MDMSKFAQKALAQLEELKLKSLLNTKTKAERYVKAKKAGYSNHFALIFALQNDQKSMDKLAKKLTPEAE
jgi:hypothetical protein